MTTQEKDRHQYTAAVFAIVIHLLEDELSACCADSAEERVRMASTIAEALTPPAYQRELK